LIFLNLIKPKAYINIRSEIIKDFSKG